MPYGQENLTSNLYLISSYASGEKSFLMSRRTDGAARAEESLLSFGRVVTEEDDSQITEITENLCDMNNR